MAQINRQIYLFRLRELRNVHFGHIFYRSKRHIALELAHGTPTTTRIPAAAARTTPHIVLRLQQIRLTVALAAAAAVILMILLRTALVISTTASVIYWCRRTAVCIVVWGIGAAGGSSGCRGAPISAGSVARCTACRIGRGIFLALQLDGLLATQLVPYLLLALHVYSHELIADLGSVLGIVA